MSTPPSPTFPPLEPTSSSANIQTTTLTSTVVGLCLWALQTYAYPDGTPGALQAAITIIIPILLGVAVHAYVRIMK